MNTFLIAFSCLLAVAYASQYPVEVIPILKDERTQDAYGGYTFDFETGNGISRQEQGSENDGQNSAGSVSYTAPDGTPIVLSFTADQAGYLPVGDHLPVAPVHDYVLPVAPALPYQRTDGGH
ncbi:unnamed protein product [Meganyctiphanes norvegica]|uniref:Uncharacterized protein n=1 Tax=Meganyctiphanes norvegica TaxID=48144 RepID=A0AAV2R5K8_MEGNR